MNKLKSLIISLPVLLGLTSCGFESAQPWNDPVDNKDLGITVVPVSANLVDKVINPYDDKDGETERHFLFEHKLLIEINDADEDKFVFKFFEFIKEDRTIGRTFKVIKSKDGSLDVNSSQMESGFWRPAKDGQGLELVSENGSFWKLITRSNSNSVLDYFYFSKDGKLIKKGELSMKPKAKVPSLKGVYGSTTCERAVVKLGTKLFAEKSISTLSAEELLEMSDAKYSLLVDFLNKKVRGDLPTRAAKKQMFLLAERKMGQLSVSYSKGMLNKGVVADKICKIFGNAKPGDCEAYLIREGVASLVALRTLKELLQQGGDAEEAIASVKMMSKEEMIEFLSSVFVNLKEEHDGIVDSKCATVVYEDALKKFLQVADSGQVVLSSQGQLEAAGEAKEKCINNTTARPFVKSIEKDVKKQIKTNCIQ